MVGASEFGLPKFLPISLTMPCRKARSRLPIHGVPPVNAKLYVQISQRMLIRQVIAKLVMMVSGPVLERSRVGLAGSDAHGVFAAEDEDLAVADLTGFRCRRDGFDRLVDLVGGDRNLDLDLGQEAYGIFGAAIDFSMALLTP